MPHPEREHELQIALATAIREVERLQEALGDAFEDGRAADKRADAAESALAAARRECEGLRKALNTIRRGGGGMDPLGRMEMSRIARDALASPAAGEEGKR